MQKTPSVAIVWFRQDLRLTDNPALSHALAAGYLILPLYILDEQQAGAAQPGAASRWWLHESLTCLNAALDGALCFAKGKAFSIIKHLIAAHPVTAVYWNRCYEPWRIERDCFIKTQLKQSGLKVQSFNSALLLEPQHTLKRDDSPYHVFTPFYKQHYLGHVPTLEDSSNFPIPLARLYKAPQQTLAGLALRPTQVWVDSLTQHWTPGENAAQACLKQFAAHALNGYKTGRDYPMAPHVSRLSPYLHFGELSPKRVWLTIMESMHAQQCENDGEYFLRELVWREFSYSLLYHHPDLPGKPLHSQFSHFPWEDNPNHLTRWQQGQTGYPIVDAGMRELWQTGYMHNRIRMIAASFLVKNLLIHWHHGEKWFWETLVDADLANNSASWQWIAGCGADAAPYFRIFNPVTQGQKFDADGDYIRRYIPELASLPNNVIHCPWTAPASLLAACNIRLGETYPTPIVELAASRKRALSAYHSLTQARI